MRLDQLEEQLRHVRKELAQIEIDTNPQSIEAAGRDRQVLVPFWAQKNHFPIDPASDQIHVSV